MERMKIKDLLKEVEESEHRQVINELWEKLNELIKKVNLITDFLGDVFETPEKKPK